MKKDFTFKDIEKLVKLCKKSGVSSLKIGDFEIILNKSDETQPKFKNRTSDAKREEERGRMQDHFNSANQDIETMHIEDPLAYEKLLLEGELENQVN